jgi:hypothetical protein
MWTYKKIKKISAIIIIIFVFFCIYVLWKIGNYISLTRHEDQYIINKEEKLILDVKENVEGFNKDMLYCVYHFYVSDPTQPYTPFDKLLIRRITITDKGRADGVYIAETRTFFNIKYANWGFGQMPNKEESSSWCKEEFKKYFTE